MKTKIILVAVMMALCVSGYAQDVIHTFDGKSVEAKILEISDDYILYKTFDNQDGPDYRMSVSSVSKIVFANGTEKVFAPADIFRTAPVAPGYNNPDFGPYGPIVYRYGRFYDSRGIIYDNQFVDYLGVSLYGSDYLKARNQLVGGIVLTSSGVGSLLMAAFVGAVANEMQPEDTVPNVLCVGSSIIGVTCLAVGIPMWVKGGRKMHAFADDYNQRYGTGKANLSLGSAPSGVGLTLNF